LIVDELVHNTETAVEDKHKMQIVIHARLKEPRPFGRTNLVLDVIDDGPGMSPDVLEFPFSRQCRDSCWPRSPRLRADDHH
jgi:hypothetical protein